MKTGAVRRVVAAIAPGVKVRAVTRWLPGDIASGVSDLGVWAVFREREHAKLFVRSDLHAKYYSSESRRLVGSANLTHAALGWSAAPNLELLVEAGIEVAELDEFEAVLFRGAVEVDEDFVHRLNLVVEQLLRDAPPVELSNDERAAPDDEGAFGEPVAYERWVPLLRRPEDLFVVYEGDRSALSQPSWVAASRDLAALRVPSGLVETQFRLFVRESLLRAPIVVALGHYLDDPKRFGEVRQFIASRLELDRATTESQTLVRWLRYFCGDVFSYGRPGYSEVLVRTSR